MVTTKMNWSGPNVIHFGRKSQFEPDQFILVMTISFWSRQNHYGQVQINLVRSKPFWTIQNCFGHIEGQGNNMLQFANNETGPTFLFQEMKALSLKMAVRFSLLLINPFLKKPKS